MTGVVKTARNIRIYCASVFRVRFGTNKLYSPQFDRELISPSFTGKVRGRTSKS